MTYSSRLSLVENDLKNIMSDQYPRTRLPYTDDLDSLLSGVCPDCAGVRWYLGPRGGAARNIECAGCASRFNVTLRDGLMVFHERIPRGGRAGPYWDPRPVKLLEPDEG